MPSITKNDLAVLQRRQRARVVRQPHELVAVFLAHPPLVNPKNAGTVWQQKAWPRYKREWRQAVARHLLEARWKDVRERLALAARDAGLVPREMAPWDYVPRMPKRVVFHATVPREYDEDGLRLALAPALDELLVVRQGVGVLSDDAPSHGHQLEYTQDVQPGRGTVYGVRIGIGFLARIKGLST